MTRTLFGRFLTCTVRDIVIGLIGGHQNGDRNIVYPRTLTPANFVGRSLLSVATGRIFIFDDAWAPVPAGSRKALRAL